jgi:hypothetical protein
VIAAHATVSVLICLLEIAEDPLLLMLILLHLGFYDVLT